MEARDRRLPEWLTRIRTRQITLPRFQRHEAWTHSTISGLLNNVVNELPAGAVLILEIGDTEPFHSRTVVGAPTTGERVTEQLLDGQQRLTSLWRTLHNDYPDRSYFIELLADEESGASYAVRSFQRWEKNGKRYPDWLNSPTRLWQENLIPVHLLRPDTESTNEFEEWAQQIADNDLGLFRQANKVGNVLRSLFAQFNIPFLSLPVRTPRETALNVFIQMNTSATPLSTYDIVVAQVEAGTGQALHDLAGDLKADVPNVAAYLDPADLILSVSALLQDKVPVKTSFLSPEFSSQLIANWDKACTGIERAIKFLEEEKILDAKRLPTDVIIAPLAALWAIAPIGGDAEGRTRTMLRKYLWRACFTDRYERTSATRVHADHRELKKLLEGENTAPKIFDLQEHPLPNLEQLLSAGWPTQKDRLPRAILALSLRAGGLDLADGSAVTRENLQKREYHHLFPVARLHEENKQDKEIYKALNCALITWKTNRTIGAKAPERYLAERCDQAHSGQDEIRARLASHMISFDNLRTNDYDDFLVSRGNEIMTLMTQLCNGQTV